MTNNPRPLSTRILALLSSAALTATPVAQAAGGATAPSAGSKPDAVQPPSAHATPHGGSSGTPSVPGPVACSRVDVGPSLTMVVGKSTLLKPTTPVSRILLGNPEQSSAGRPMEARGDKAPGMMHAALPMQHNPRRPGVADVDVLLLGPTELYLLGKTVGTTNVILLDREGTCTAIDVMVGMDTSVVDAAMRELIPGANIRVRALGNAVALQGTVPDAQTVDRAVDVATAFVRRTLGGAAGGRAQGHDDVINMLSVAAPQQVMLEVKVAEVSKSVLDQYGINFARAYSPADNAFVRFLSGVFGGQGLVAGNLSSPQATVSASTTSAGTSISGNVVVPGTGTVGLGISGTAANASSTAAITAPSAPTAGGQIPLATGKGATSVGINAQKQDGLVKILAEPTVMAISGQEGRFLAGGRIFIPVAQGNPAGGTTITLEEKEFGVRLSFLPTVLSDGRINLKVNPEVSELNAAGVAVTTLSTSGSVVLPSFSVRSASTTVQLADGQSFAIGGLIRNNVTANISAFPFLGELPVLGALFRSTSFQNDRSELVFVVTPRLARPLAPGHALPTDAYIPPTRSDVIFGGRLEGRPADDEPRGGFQTR